MATVTKVEYRLDDGGSTKQRLNDTKALNKEISKTRGENTAYGQARASGSGTGAAGRDFANQAQGLGGLVRLYATYAANIFAVSAAFRALSDAQNTSNMIQGLDQLGTSSGMALGSLAKRFSDATGGAISLREAIESTAKASSSGLSSEQFLKLGEVAKKASQALGVNMSDAVSRLTRGITKLEPELLDELGIFTKVGTATENYAKSVGKSVSSLTDFERRQAFANAVLQEGADKFSNINIDTNPYDKFLATLRDVSQSVLALINTGITPLVNLLSSSPNALLGILTLVGAKIVKQAIPAITEYKNLMVTNLEQVSKVSKEKSAAAKASFMKLTEAARTDALNQKEAAQEAALARATAAEQLIRTNKKLSKSVLAIIDPTREVMSITEQEIAHLNRLQGSNKMVTKSYREMAAAITLAQKEQRAFDSVNAIYTAKQEKGPGRFTQPGKLAREAASARKDAFSANYLASISSTFDVSGFTGAFDKLNRNAGRLTKSLGLVGGNILKLKAFGLIAARGIGVLASGLLSFVSGPLMVALTLFPILDGIFSTNSEALSKLSGAFDTNKEAVKTATNVTEMYADKALSVDKINAYNNSLSSVASSVAEVSAAFADVTKNSSLWDKGVDWVKSFFGADSATRAGQAIKDSISKGLELVNDPSIKSKAETALKNVLNIKSLDKAALENLDPAKLAKLSPEIAKILKSASEASKEIALPITQAVASVKALDDGYKNYANSLNKSTPLQTLLAGQVKAYNDISIALKSSTENAKALIVELSKGASIKYLSQEVQQAASSLAALQPLLDQFTAKQAEAQKQVDILRQAIASLPASGADATRKVLEEQLRAAEATLESTTQSIINGIKPAQAAATKVLTDAIVKSGKDAIKEITSGMARASREAQISLQKAQINSFLQTPESINKLTDLEIESIAVRIQEIQSLNNLADVMLKTQTANELARNNETLSALPEGDPRRAGLEQSIKQAKGLQRLLDASPGKDRDKVLKELEAQGDVYQGVLDFIGRTGQTNQQITKLQGQQSVARYQGSLAAIRAGISLQQESRTNQLTTNDLLQQRRELSPAFRGMSFYDQSIEQETKALNKEQEQAAIKLLAIEDNIKRTTGDTRLIYEAQKTTLMTQSGITQDIISGKAALARLSESERITNENNLRTLQSEADLSSLKMEGTKELLDAEKQYLDIQLNRGQITQDQYNLSTRALQLKDIEVERTAKLLQLENARKLAMAGYDAIINSTTNRPEDRQKATLDKAAYDQLYAAQVAAANKTADMKARFVELAPVVSDSMQTMADSIKGAFNSAGDAIANFVTTGKWNFKDLVNSILADMARAQIQKQFSNLGNMAMNAFIGMFSPTVGAGGGNIKAGYVHGGWAQGGAFNSGVEKFAQGGMFTNKIVSSPTLFKFAQGTGLMGEAGPEAIMPLKRDANGTLGVRADGSKTEVVINNYGNDKATATESVDSRGNRRIDVTIGEMAGASLSTTGSSSQRSMASTYGMKPQLIRR